MKAFFQYLPESPALLEDRRFEEARHKLTETLLEDALNEDMYCWRMDTNPFNWHSEPTGAPIRFTEAQ